MVHRRRVNRITTQGTLKSVRPHRTSRDAWRGQNGELRADLPSTPSGFATPLDPSSREWGALSDATMLAGAWSPAVLQPPDAVIDLVILTVPRCPSRRSPGFLAGGAEGSELKLVCMADHGCASRTNADAHSTGAAGSDEAAPVR